MNNRLNQVRVEYKKAYDIMLEHNNLGALSNMIGQRYNVDRALLIIDEWVHHYHRDWVVKNLNNHFPNEHWEISQSQIENFASNEKFDLVISILKTQTAACR